MSKKRNWLKQKYIEIQESWADGLTTPKQRRLAKIDAHLGDHAFLRIFWTNLSPITEDVWRSNQPSPAQIKNLANQGIRTIVNLRGPSRWGSYALEKEACEKYGIELINHRMYSRRMPTFEELVDLKALFDRLSGKVLFHCKSGADRAGMCSALYVLMAQKKPVEQAQAQLSIRYLHIKHSKTGRLDYFLEAYRAFNEKTPIDFMEWAEHHYNREKLTQEFHTNKWYDWFTDKVLRRE